MNGLTRYVRKIPASPGNVPRDRHLPNGARATAGGVSVPPTARGRRADAPFAQATRPNHHTDRPADSTASSAPSAANSALTSVSLRSTTMREDSAS